MNAEKLFRNHYLIAFFVTLSFSLGMMAYGLFTEPKGEIDNSIIVSVGELFLWPSLALGAKALSEGRKMRVSRGQTTFTIGNTDGPEPPHFEPVDDMETDA